MRVGLDATPLLGQVTGVGTYTRNLMDALRGRFPGDELVATAFTLRGAGELAAVVPSGVTVRTRPLPARALRTLWARDVPLPVEVLCGRVDVFHATNFVLPPSRGARGVLTIHDLAYLRFPDTVSDATLAYRELVPRGVSRAAMVCTPSWAVAEQVQDAYAVPADRISVTPLGVDPVWFDATPLSRVERAAQGLPPEYLLAVGTLEPRKNLAALLAAYRLLLTDLPEAPPLVLAGGAGWGAALDLSEFPSGAVVLTGHLPYADLRRLVAGATLLAFPSLDEGFGLPPLEALACGVPVLANDLPVTREVLGGAASYCDATDVAGLADAVRVALTAPVGTSAQRREQAGGFTWQRCAEATHAAYERALA